jgi:hypothetical protein
MLLASINAASAPLPGVAGRAVTASNLPANREPFLLMQLISDASKQELAVLQASLATVIDWDTSKERRQLSVHAGVDATLDAYRHTFASEHFCQCG